MPTERRTVVVPRWQTRSCLFLYCIWQQQFHIVGGLFGEDFSFSLILLSVQRCFWQREFKCLMYDPKCRLFLMQTARTNFIRVSWQMANYICCCFLQQQFLTVWGGLVCILAFHLNYCISRQVFLQCVLMPGTRPQMQSVVGADSKKDVRCAQLAEREGYRHFLIAFERSSSIQFEGGSTWIPAF